MADMLSRAPEANRKKQSKQDQKPVDTAEANSDVPDQTYCIGTLNSSKFTPKEYAHYTPPKQPEEGPQLREDIDIVEDQWLLANQYGG